MQSCLLITLGAFLFSSAASATSAEMTIAEANITKSNAVLTISEALLDITQTFLSPAIAVLNQMLFFDIPIPFSDKAIPFLILWLIIGSVFFTLRLGFVNIRMFTHAIAVVRGKYSSGKEPGDITHAQALFAAVSATVGVGNIAGVAIAVSMGGPGAVVWMAIAGLLGMSTKFAEVTLGQRFRHIDENGRISGGAFHYLEDGLKELNYPRLGKFLAIVFAIFCIGGALGGGNMFQSNQAIAMLTSISALSQAGWMIALGLSITVGIVLFGGIKRIAHVAEAIVPLMALIYTVACLVILFIHSSDLGNAFFFMIKDAFTGEALGGGLVGALIVGFRRASFSNEAGLGSAPIAHSAAKTSEPVREGCVGLLEPFIDTVVICFMTGLVITVTGVYTNDAVSNNGILMTSNAFATVISWFPIVLSIAVTLFAFSTMLTWSYYGERSWHYLFGPKFSWLFYLIFCSATFVGGVAHLGIIIELSDLMMLAMALPNLIGLYMLSNRVHREMKQYISKLKAGKFAIYE